MCIEAGGVVGAGPCDAMLQATAKWPPNLRLSPTKTRRSRIPTKKRAHQSTIFQNYALRDGK